MTLGRASLQAARGLLDTGYESGDWKKRATDIEVVEGARVRELLGRSRVLVGVRTLLLKLPTSLRPSKLSLGVEVST